MIDGNRNDLAPLTWVAEHGERIAVSQEQDSRVIFFDSNGAFLGRTGRRGSGPGEFKTLSAGGWLADTLWVYDGQLGRVTLFDPANPRGSSRTILPLGSLRPAADTVPQFAEVYPRAVYHDHSILAAGILARWDGEGRRPYLVVVSGRAIDRVVAALPQDSSEIRKRTSYGFISAKVPNAAVALDDVSGNGDVAAIAHVAIDTDAPAFDLTLVNVAGDTLMNRRYNYSPQSVPQSIRSRQEANIRRRQARIPEYPNIRVPRYYPPLRSVLLGEDSSVWLELRAREGERTWMVVDFSGAVLDTITLPASMRLLVASLGHIWIAESDPHGVESIVRYLILNRST